MAAGFGGRLSGQLAEEPGAGDFPVAHDGIGGDFHHLGGFFDAEPAEEAEFDDAGLSRIDLGEGVERVVEGDEFARFHLRDVERLGEIEGLGFGATLGRDAAAGAVEQDAAHEGGGDGEEVRPMLPVQLARVHQAEIGFVNEIGALEAMAGALVLEQAGSHAAEFAIDAGG